MGMEKLKAEILAGGPAYSRPVRRGAGGGFYGARWHGVNGRVQAEKSARGLAQSKATGVAETERNTMKVYVLYHGNCPDGFGAAFVAWLTYGTRAEYIPVSYGKPVPVMEDRSTVYIVDFSYPREVLLELKSRMATLVVLDHHATAAEDLKGLDFCTFDMERSGAMLAWRFFRPEEPEPTFIRYLQDRDLWKFEMPLSREVSMAVRSYPYDFEVWENIAGMTRPGQRWGTNQHGAIGRLSDEGVACRRLTEVQVELMARHHYWMRFRKDGGEIVRSVPSGSKPLYTVTETGGEITQSRIAEDLEDDYWAAPVANATVFFSEVGEKLLEMYPEAEFAAYYSDRADGGRQWGLRSRQSFDCSVVARAFGGGGHKCASGFVQKGV